MGTGGPFPRGKAWPGSEADHSPPSSANVKNEYEIYFLSCLVPAWRRGTALLLLSWHFLRELRKTMKNVVQDTRYLSRDLRPGLPEYEAGVLTTRCDFWYPMHEKIYSATLSSQFSICLSSGHWLFVIFLLCPFLYSFVSSLCLPLYCVSKNKILKI
jgi:hypothetical protein